MFAPADLFFFVCFLQSDCDESFPFHIGCPETEAIKAAGTKEVPSKKMLILHLAPLLWLLCACFSEQNVSFWTSQKFSINYFNNVKMLLS